MHGREMHNAKNAKVNKEWLLLRNELRERACKEASSAVQWSGVEEVEEVVEVVGGGGGRAPSARFAPFARTRHIDGRP